MAIAAQKIAVFLFVLWCVLWLSMAIMGTGIKLTFVPVVWGGIIAGSVYMLCGSVIRRMNKQLNDLYLSE